LKWSENIEDIDTTYILRNKTHYIQISCSKTEKGCEKVEKSTVRCTVNHKKKNCSAFGICWQL